MARKVLLVRMRNDTDIMETMKAIVGLPNVSCVENVEENIDQQIGYFRAKAELQEKLWQVLKE
jgi:hypothetical protein